MSKDRPILLVRSGGDSALPAWKEVFSPLLPDIDVRGWNDASVLPEAVRYVLVWQPDPGRLATYPNLRVIFSSAAGVDHITGDPARPAHVPIIRMGADEMAQTVGEYACLAALTILRDLPRMLDAQREARWDAFVPPRTARDTRIGIMGMGAIGRATAVMLRGIGFPVHGWSRTPREVPGVEGSVGPDALPAFLARCDILVAILPETPETIGLLNAAALARLPRGAGIVNVGRGSLVVLPDLLMALDSGQIGRAMLDVFETEPLPASDPAWRHPRLIVTPHVAGFASRPARAAWVADCVRAHEAGQTLPNAYDPDRGY